MPFIAWLFSLSACSSFSPAYKTLCLIQDPCCIVWGLVVTPNKSLSSSGPPLVLCTFSSQSKPISKPAIRSCSFSAWNHAERSYFSQLKINILEQTMWLAWLKEAHACSIQAHSAFLPVPEGLQAEVRNQPWGGGVAELAGFCSWESLTFILFSFMGGVLPVVADIIDHKPSHSICSIFLIDGF